MGEKKFFASFFKKEGLPCFRLCSQTPRRQPLDCTLERRGDGGPGYAVRLGLRMVKGLGNEPGAELVARRGDTPYGSVEEIWRRAGISASMLERLAEADAFSGIGLDRRQALWAVRGLADTVLPLFAAADGGGPPQPEVVEPHVPLVPMREGREVVEDYESIGLTLGRHPVAFLRQELSARGMVASGDLEHTRDGCKVVVPWHRSGAAEAGLGQGRDVHHNRGRDRHRNPDPVGGPLREAAPTGAVGRDDRLSRPRAARG